MCLIFIANEAHPDYPLVVAANRDEYHARPTQPAAFWPDAPDLVAGRDLEAGGTWLGVTRSGRFAAITNYRDGEKRSAGAPSRGALVSEFLTGTAPAADYLADVAEQRSRYNGFSLIAGDGEALCYYSNRGCGLLHLEPGIYGLSNHLLDSPWPKVTAGKARFGRLLAVGTLAAEPFFGLLADTEQRAREDAAQIDAGAAGERALSAIFVAAGAYGTRCSTVIIKQGDDICFAERSFDASGAVQDTVVVEFTRPKIDAEA